MWEYVWCKQKGLTKRPNVSWSWKVSSLNIKFSYFCTLAFSNKTHAACEKCFSQPNHQTKCWQCLSLHNNWYVKTFKYFVAMLQVFVSLGSVFNSILWQRCASTLVSFGTKSTWLGLGKDDFFVFKIPVLVTTNTAGEFQRSFLKPWFHTYSFRKSHPEQWSLACNSTTILSNFRHLV